MLISRRFCAQFSMLGVPALALGCVAPVDYDTEPVASMEAGLFRATVDMRTGGEVRLWTENNNVVPVCWIQSGWESREKTIIQDAVDSTWAAQTSLQFTWNGICPTSGSQKFVRINITTVAAGEEGGRVPPTIGLTTLRAPNESPSMEVKFRSPSSALSPGDVSWIQYIGVHEFGHVLGFDHEMNRWDNPQVADCPPEMGLQNPNGIGQGYYDRDSIMNYCGPKTGTLTTWDRLGAQQVYARPGSRFAGVSTDGHLWHSFRNTTSTWSAFADVEAAAGNIGTVTDVAMQVLKGGSTRLLATTSTGGLHLTTRSRSGNWSPFSDFKAQAGNVGSFSRVAAAEVSESLHVLGVTTNGRIWHGVLGVMGGVQAFANIETLAGERGTFVNISGTGLWRGPMSVGGTPIELNNAELHVCGVTSDGHLWHTIRSGNGSWAQFGDVEDVAGHRGSFTDVDCVAMNGLMWLVGTTSTGGIHQTVRFADGSWDAFWDVKGSAGDPGTARSVAVTQFEGELQVTVRTSDDKAFNTIRDVGGAWSGFADISAQAGSKAFARVGMD